MNTNTSPILGFNKEQFIRVILISFLFGLVAHSFSYFNLLHTHDSLDALSCGPDSGQIAWKIELGRIIQVPYYQFRGHLSAPWLIGFLSLGYLAAANYLLIELFQLKKKWLRDCLCALTATSTVLASSNAVYIHESDIFMLSLFFSVAAVFIFQRYRYGFIWAILPLVISLGLYQAYLSLSITLVLILLMLHLLQKRDLKEFWLRGIQSGIFLSVSVASYFVLVRIVYKLTSIYPTASYNSIHKPGLNFLLQLISSVGSAYMKVWACYLNPLSAYPYAMPAASVIVLILIIYSLLILIRQNKLTLISSLLIASILFILPLGMGVLYLLSGGIYHILMQFSITGFFILLLVLINQQTKLASWMKWASALCLGFIVFSNIVYANHLYLQRQLIQKNDLSIKTRILYDIEHTEGYEFNKTRVVFSGNFLHHPINSQRAGFEHIRGYGITPNASMMWFSSIKTGFDLALGYPIQIADTQETIEVSKKEAVIAMPYFPNPGYCQMIDGDLVIKLHDQSDYTRPEEH